MAWEFNGITKEQAEELCRVHCIANAHYLLDNWDSYTHVKTPTLESVFKISNMSHLFDEFVATVKTREQAMAFCKQHNLKPHQVENIRIHWKQVKSLSQQ